MLRGVLMPLAFCLLYAVARSQELPSIFPDDDGTFPQGRHNFCDLHRQVESGNATRLRILEGMELRVALFTYQLDKETGGIPELPDISVKFLDALAERAGFTWRNSYGTIPPPIGNETWDSMLFYAIDRYDLLGDWYLRSTARLSEGVLFPDSWYDGSIIMVRENLVKDNGGALSFLSIFSFLRPFTIDLWLVIIAVTVASGLVLYMLEYLDDKRYTNQQMKFSLLESLFGAFVLFVGYFNGRPRSTATRVMSLSLSFFYLILIAAYTANLTSFLVVDMKAALPPIDNINDAIKQGQSFCVLNSSGADIYITKNHPSARVIRKNTIDDTYNSVQSGECDIVLSTVDTFNSRRRTLEYNPNCDLEWVGRRVEAHDAGFTLRDSETLCSSLLRDVIAMHLVEMKVSGQFDQIWNSHRKTKTDNSCFDEINESSSQSEEEDLRISLKQSCGIFIFHACATFLAILISLVQYKRKVPTTKTEKDAGTAETITDLVQQSAQDDFRRTQLQASVGRDLLAARQYRDSLQPGNFTDNVYHTKNDCQVNPQLSLIREEGGENGTSEEDMDDFAENSMEVTLKTPTGITIQEQQLKLLNQIVLEMAADNQRQQDEMKELRESIAANNQRQQDEMMKMRHSMDKAMKKIVEVAKVMDRIDEEQHDVKFV